MGGLLSSPVFLSALLQAAITIKRNADEIKNAFFIYIDLQVMSFFSAFLS
jgi:hypothetical protein